MSNKILFLTLKTFSATGGIEKVCKVVGKVLYEEQICGTIQLNVFSMYDKQSDSDHNLYFPGENFKGYAEYKLRFILSAIREGKRSNKVILSHINLLPVGWVIKLISPKTELILFAHGIEVWEPLSWLKTKMLKSCDRFFAVSKYTAKKIEKIHSISSEHIEVLNNSLDPLLEILQTEQIIFRSDLMRKKYGYSSDDIIIFTLTRLNSTERYKGYDVVLESICNIVKKHPNVHYLIAGRYDVEEKKNLEKKAKSLGVENNFKLAGYIPDEELVGHFTMSDVYVMPSRKEGFGIVFVEAMYYGIPVIAGNQDGSVDALLNGKLGTLVNPTNPIEVENAIKMILFEKRLNKVNKHLLIENFGYEAYKRSLVDLLI